MGDAPCRDAPRGGESTVRGADEVSQQATDIEVRAGSPAVELPDVGGCRQRGHPVERIEVVPSLLCGRHPMTIVRSGHPAIPPRARFWLLHHAGEFGAALPCLVEGQLVRQAATHQHAGVAASAHRHVRSSLLRPQMPASVGPPCCPRQEAAPPHPAHAQATSGTEPGHPRQTRPGNSPRRPATRGCRTALGNPGLETSDWPPQHP